MERVLTLVRGLFGIEHRPPHNSEQVSSVRLKISTGAAFVVGVGVVVVAVVLAMIPQPDKQSIPLELMVTSTPGVEEASTGRGNVLVHVVGDIANPGIYELALGARVIDAVMAAGGFNGEINECGINLARVLVDGEQITVQTNTAACTTEAVSSSGEIRINSASADQLEGLPGIGPAIAQRIISLREERGGFRALEELREVSGIGEKLFAGLQGHIAL